ncbi:MAG: putative FmdB family regulatory protein [Cognaticolwellia sp.]|jgi:putative FmdB family regulatory protein
MPVYDYKCADHGLFFELASMDDHAEPAPCPKCATLSARIIMMAPGFLNMAKEKKDAIERNETAMHEPQHSTANTRAENAEKLKHGSGCTHKKRGIKLMYTPEGNKMFPSMRPWMISH